MNLRNDRYYDPPDEEEAKFCDECGEELEWKPDMVGNTPMCSGYWECTNSYCPEKFEKYSDRNMPYQQVVKDMAKYLVEVEEKLKSTQASLRFTRNSLSHQQQIRERREKTIEELEKEIDKAVAQSQPKEVLRDTDYQIKRMEDAIQEVEKDTIHPDWLQTDVNYLRKEWSEVKKILLQGE